jgi:AraC-like DNA-binding protein
MSETAGAQPAAHLTLDRAADDRTRARALRDLNHAEDDRARARALRELGMSTVAIGRELGRSSSTIRRWLREMGIDTSVAALRSGRISATEAARRFDVDRHTLIQALAGGRVRGERISRGRGGNECLFYPAELEHDLNALTACVYEGCGRRALGASGGCEHHGHVLRGGRARGVPRPDIGPKISAAKQGRERPDARERLRSAWAQPEGSAFTKGWAKWRGGRVAQRWLGRWSGNLGGRPTLAATDADFADKAAKAIELRRANPRLGAREIAKRVGLSRWKVRELLSQPRAS